MRQRVGTGVHRDELRQEGHRLGGHAFELEGDQVDLVRQLAQMILVAVVGPQVLAQRRGTGIRGRVQESEIHPQWGAGQGQHATQLAATDYTDLHIKEPQA